MINEQKRNEMLSNLFLQYYDYLVGYCRRLVGANRQDLQMMVEDIVQSVFLLAVEQYDKLEEHPNKIGWLKKCCKYSIKIR